MNIAEKVLLFICIAWFVWTLACSVPHSKPKAVHITNRIGNPPTGGRK